IVDDEAYVLHALKRELEGEGFRVSIFDDPHAALDAFKSNPFPLIIADHRMPGIVGTELLEQVKQIAPDTARILLTGYSDLDVVIAAINQGAVHRYLVKPWNKAALLAHVRECLEMSRLWAQHHQLLRELEDKTAFLAHANEELRRLASRDNLTGLLNRRQFELDLESQSRLHARDRQPFCLAMCDIDDFKRVNDTHGHPIGDLVLKTIAQGFVAAMRDAVDSFYRFGGEEFAILMRNTTLAGARHALERLLHAVRTSKVPTPGEALTVTVSIGCGEFQSGQATAHFVAAVDRALYQAKRAGKDRYVVVDNPTQP
ncbi:MAG: diguanylate cyclase, partial [Candidatus Lambdaproteobacteria bacterium]|nr:diguanylate cyclase [Candidatus Lambdaproteobacteria bacterium]